MVAIPQLLHHNQICLEVTVTAGQAGEKWHFYESIYYDSLTDKILGPQGGEILKGHPV